MFAPQRRLSAAYWPYYTERLLGGVAAGALLMAAGALSGWWGLLPLGGLVILATAYFYAASGWVVERLHNPQRTTAVIWEVGGLEPDAVFGYLGCGGRATAVALSRRLRRGRLTAVDLYHPQLTPARALWRVRLTEREAHATDAADPRLEWVDGSADLLPWPDEALDVLALDQVLFELADGREQERLLQAAVRALQPGGRLIIVEPVRQPANRWVQGLARSRQWPSAVVRRSQLHGVGLVVREERRLNGVLMVWRGDKPARPPRQLVLPL